MNLYRIDNNARIDFALAKTHNNARSASGNYGHVDLIKADAGDVDLQICLYLQSIGVRFHASILGQTIKNGWECDQHVFSLSKDAGKTWLRFDYFTGTGHRRPNKQGDKMPVPANPAGVLSCIITDADAGDMSFSAWCAEYGYSDDSIKAFDAYRSCCETDKKLLSVFSRAQIEKLREMLTDY